MTTPPPAPSQIPQQPQAIKPQRILACVLCQQRKVKCDRQFPCANCVRSRAQCVQASLNPRPRKRRFAERELVERVKTYEELLRKNGIPFEPLYKSREGKQRERDDDDADVGEGGQNIRVQDDSVSPTSTVKFETIPTTKNILHVVGRGFRTLNHDSDSSSEGDEGLGNMIRQAWDQQVDNGEHLLLFGTRSGTIDLSVLHPDPVQIFRLWQIYLENVNPIYKVTHTPTLQAKVIEAASSVNNIEPKLEALMFSIYCMAILSMREEDCQTTFGAPKADLLLRYQTGCQQALSNCAFLRTNERDCLTALFLYLNSVRPQTVPQSLSSLLGIAIRIAQRMDLCTESSLTKLLPFEAEMRRRLWWALIILDHRIGGLSGMKKSSLNPTWDCAIPLNVNDCDLRPDMKEPPVNQSLPTEAIFAVVRAELDDFVRHSPFHLDFSNPILKRIARPPVVAADGFDVLETFIRYIDTRYLSKCDTGNPVHFMTVWIAREYLTKCQLLNAQVRFIESTNSSSPDSPNVEANIAAASSHALKILACDTRIMETPFARGFIWLNHLYFPFPAYLQLVQDVRRSPAWNAHTRVCWDAMSRNSAAWFDSKSSDLTTVFYIFSKLVLQAWEPCEAALREQGAPIEVPGIVMTVRAALSGEEPPRRGEGPSEMPGAQPAEPFNVAGVQQALPQDIPGTNEDQNMWYSLGMQDGFAMSRPDLSSPVAGQTHPVTMPSPMGPQFGWTSLGMWPGWGSS